MNLTLNCCENPVVLVGHFCWYKWRGNKVIIDNSHVHSKKDMLQRMSLNLITTSCSLYAVISTTSEYTAILNSKWYTYTNHLLGLVASLGSSDDKSGLSKHCICTCFFLLCLCVLIICTGYVNHLHQVLPHPHVLMPSSAMPPPHGEILASQTSQGPQDARQTWGKGGIYTYVGV